MVARIFKGFDYVLQGFSLIGQKGIRPFVVIPFVINLIFFAGGIWLAQNQMDRWLTHFLPQWLDWLEWLLMPIFMVLLFFVVFYVFTLMANIIAAPFNSLLAERVEAHLNGLPVPEFDGLASIPGLIIRTFRSELHKLWYMLKWLILLVLITIIPGLNLISPVAWTIYGAWMLAIEYIDYPMGNHNRFFKDELSALKQYTPEALGFGGLLSLMTSIPVLNFLSMPVGVAGATAMWVDKISKIPAR